MLHDVTSLHNNDVADAVTFDPQLSLCHRIKDITWTFFKCLTKFEARAANVKATRGRRDAFMHCWEPSEMQRLRGSSTFIGRPVWKIKHKGGFYRGETLLWKICLSAQGCATWQQLFPSKNRRLLDKMELFILLEKWWLVRGSPGSRKHGMKEKLFQT